MKKTNLISIIAAALLLPAAQVLAQHHRFDAGPESGLAEGARPLTADHLFDEASGFGWVQPPQNQFRRDDLERIRSDFLIDGVSGTELEFRIDVPNGKWWVTLWFESGKEDSTTMSIRINGNLRPLNWHAFNPPSEPRSEIQSIYRMFHGSASVSDGSVVIEMTGGEDLVRLLGITVTADPTRDPTRDSTQVPTQVPTQPDSALMSRIERLGTYGPHLRLEEIMAGEEPEMTALADELQQIAETDPNNTFAAYWLEQLMILRDAEQNIRLMGWEWARDSTGQGIFDRFHQAVMQLDGLLGRPGVESYPLYERALFQRGRLQHWLYLERGGENTRIQGEYDLAALWARYPEDELLSMYNGEQIRTSSPCDELDAGSSAPEWSVLELEALCRLRDEIHWWVNDRQSDTGEFGGKIGDDVELFRWWPPVVLSGDTTAFRGWKRLADGVMVARKVHKGYSRRVIDVEHASEFIADTAPEMVVYSDEPEYVDRLRFSSDYFNNLWTAYNPSGRRFFKSAWFSSTEVDERPPRNRDLEMNTRAVKAVRYLAWKTGDEKVIKPLHEWSSAWRHAAMRTEKGKPAGIIPASVRFRDEALNGDEPTWYKANMFWDYFDWENRGTQMLDQLLFTYTLTGDEALLEPMFASIDLIRDFEEKGWPAGESAKEGSAEWAAGKLKRRGQFWNSVEQWRFHTGDTRHDDLLLEFGTPYVRFRLSGDERHLVGGLNGLLDDIRYNAPLRTTEVLHTDRVRTPGAMHLKAMLTGDGTAEGSSPYYAVSWRNTGDGFTALVTDATSDVLDVRIFDHSSTKFSSVILRVWKLAPGSYTLNQNPEADPASGRLVEIKERGQPIQINLVGRSLTTIRFERVQ